MVNVEPLHLYSGSNSSTFEQRLMAYRRNVHPCEVFDITRPNMGQKKMKIARDVVEPVLN